MNDLIFINILKQYFAKNMIDGIRTNMFKQFINKYAFNLYDTKHNTCEAPVLLAIKLNLTKLKRKHIMMQLSMWLSLIALALLK